jgi:hypothetical protein
LYRAVIRDKQTGFIDRFLKSRDRWMLFVSERLRIFGNERTNRVEGFFGSGNYGTHHQIRCLTGIAGLVKSLAQTSMADLFHIMNNAEVSVAPLA